VYCPGSLNDQDCLEKSHLHANSAYFKFSKLSKFEEKCLTCHTHDYVSSTYVFNAFVFCQLFNEFNARSIASDVDVFSGLESNPVFQGVIVFSVALQFLIVNFGGEFVKTSPLTGSQWLTSILYGLISTGVGILMRFIPVEEDENSFVTHDMDLGSSKVSLSIDKQ
jgi:magnesium-transporting ATPase (P-type)